MNKRLEYHAAQMRRRNAGERLKITEQLRRKAFCAIDRDHANGKLTEREAAGLKRDFWEQRYKDLLIKRGRISA